jgi:energy-converting hydrogenase Eha subunit B
MRLGVGLGWLILVLILIVLLVIGWPGVRELKVPLAEIERRGGGLDEG